MIRQSYTNRVLDVANKLAKHRWALEKAAFRMELDDSFFPPTYEDCLLYLTKKERAQLEFVDWKTYEDK